MRGTSEGAENIPSVNMCAEFYISVRYFYCLRTWESHCNQKYIVDTWSDLILCFVASEAVVLAL